MLTPVERGANSSVRTEASHQVSAGLDGCVHHAHACRCERWRSIGDPPARNLFESKPEAKKFLTEIGQPVRDKLVTHLNQCGRA
ncbi:hypothetical protein [Frigoriglobus tundricola]|uniref:Uncharacterized protein n=1 Tax=Frigoriglobus tundricola TaxID=2774151 RepID=A0A6M5YYE5_9BACT|nr:hypothetical protein [Frigoriglobus tundricola]QJW99039.1 hypothetical protein FTUN_6636 [Frigoriglobus tundricola]